MSSSEGLISTKELASKLKITEPLLKKLIKDFDINTERVDKRQHLDSKASTTVREILALRASGKKNNEIKEMLDASRAPESKKPEAKPEPAAKAENKTTEEKPTETKEQKKNIKKPFKKKTKEKNPAAEKPEVTEPEAITQVDESSTETVSEEAQATQDSSEETGVLDISGYLQEDEKEDDEIKSLLAIEEGDEDISSIEEEQEEVDEIEEITDDTISPRKIRRRQFSFKYIQRQIANDSKRVNYIKQKLNRGRISTKERLQLEDSLYHRSILLSGWIQLLRWVKN